MEMKHTYGCLPAKYDARDYKLCSSKAPDIKYPEKFELSKLPRVKNQGNVNSCCAHATSSILEYYAHNCYYLSTNFIYGIQKKLFNQTQMGMYLVDACKIAQQYGDMTEIDCAGNDEIPKCYRFAEMSLKDDNKKASAHRFRIDSYYLCQSDNDIKYALMHYGPVLGAVLWRDTYTIDSDGTVNFNLNSQGGGHAIMIYGWNQKGWLIQNSWGEKFAVGGRFILPYSYGLLEARAVIDCYNDEELKGNIVLQRPVNNIVFNVFYKIKNFFVNTFSKKGE